MFLYISCISLNTGLFRSPTLGFMHACTILSSLRGGPFPTILAEPGPSQAYLGVQSNHAPLNRLHFPDRWALLHGPVHPSPAPLPAPLDL